MQVGPTDPAGAHASNTSSPGAGCLSRRKPQWTPGRVEHHRLHHRLSRHRIARAHSASIMVSSPSVTDASHRDNLHTVDGLLRLVRGGNHGAGNRVSRSAVFLVALHGPDLRKADSPNTKIFPMACFSMKNKTP
jgi:hypothetical protein